MAAQPAITIGATEDGRRCIPPHITANELAQVFDWLKLSPKAWAKMKVEGIPPHIERQLEIRLCVLETIRNAQKTARFGRTKQALAEDPKSQHYISPFTSHSDDTDDVSLRAAIEKIESPRRTRILIEAILEDIKVPSIDCDPVKSYGLHDEIVKLIHSASRNANSVAAKDLVFGLVTQAEHYRKDNRIDIALELEFLVSAIDLIAYRKRERPVYAKNLWF